MISDGAYLGAALTNQCAWFLSTNLLYPYLKSLFEPFYYLPEGILALRLLKHAFPILYRCHKMIVNLINIMAASPERSHALLLYCTTPRGKPRGILKLIS